MKYVRLGLTDTYISCIGFGCAAMGGYDYGVVDDSESKAAVRKALELGLNFFDTADVYGLGHAEKILCEALGSQRKEVLIATKVGVRWDNQGNTKRDLRPKTIVRALEESLRRLKLDCIPLYQVHWPDPSTPIEETLETLNKCQDDGKIRYIGCCNFPFELVEKAQKYSRLESIQLPFSLAEKGFEDVITNTQKKYSMSVFCYNTLAHGLLTGKYGKNSEFEGTDLRRRADHFHGEKLKENLAIIERLKVVAKRCGKTPAQVAIRWVLECPSASCAITGIKTSKQVQDNCGSVDWQFSKEDYESLRNLS